MRARLMRGSWVWAHAAAHVQGQRRPGLPSPTFLDNLCENRLHDHQNQLFQIRREYWASSLLKPAPRARPAACKTMVTRCIRTVYSAQTVFFHSMYSAKQYFSHPYPLPGDPSLRLYLGLVLNHRANNAWPPPAWTRIHTRACMHAHLGRWDPPRRAISRSPHRQHGNLCTWRHSSGYGWENYPKPAARNRKNRVRTRKIPT